MSNTDVELKTPAEWAKQKNLIILDHDGWRTGFTANGEKWRSKDFGDPISEYEFTTRVSISTIRIPPAGSTIAE
jgi:hypothetical protein